MSDQAYLRPNRDKDDPTHHRGLLRPTPLENEAIQRHRRGFPEGCRVERACVIS